MPIDGRTLSNWGEGKLLAVINGILGWLYGYCFAINVKDFGASGSRKTATGTTTAGSNLLTVTGVGASTFLATCKVGHGVFVDNAGAEGDGNDLVERITAINGSVLTLANPATSPVNNAFICHDDTEAIQAAINSGYYRTGEVPGVNLPSGFGRTVFLYSGLFGEEGYYQVNKKWTASHNSILTVPIIPVTEQSRSFKMIADFRVSPHWVNLNEASNPLKARGGATLRTKLLGSGVYPAIISAKVHSSALGEDYQSAFSHVSCHVEDISFELPNTSNTIAANFGNAINSSVKRCFVHADLHQSLITPTNTHGGGFVMSQTNNTGLIYIEDTVVVSGKVAYVIGEHTQIRYAFGAFCNLLFRITESHRPIFGTFGGEHNICTIETTGQASINLSGNIEYFAGTTGFATPRYGFIKDATNSLFGNFGTNFTEGNVGLTSRQATVTGCSGLKFTQTTMPFVNDDGGAANALVERLLPASDFTANAVMKDEFFRPGAIDGRVPDVLQRASEVWQNISVGDGSAKAAINNFVGSPGGATVSLYGAGSPVAEFRLKYIEGSAVKLLCRAVDANNFLGAILDRSALTLQFVKSVGGVQTNIGAALPNVIAAVNGWVSIECTAANVLQVKVNDVIVGQQAGVTEFASATRVGVFVSSSAYFARAEIVPH